MRSSLESFATPTKETFCSSKLSPGTFQCQCQYICDGVCPLRTRLLLPERPNQRSGSAFVVSPPNVQCVVSSPSDSSQKTSASGFSFFLFPSALQRFAVLSCARRSLSCRVHVKNSRLAGLLDNLKWNYSACACVTEGARVCACVCMRTCVSQGLQKCFSQAEMLISGPMHQGSFSPLTSCSGKHGAET